MDHAIPPATVPAPLGLEKEEPELAYEEDIPSDGRDSEALNEDKAERE